MPLHCPPRGRTPSLGRPGGGYRDHSRHCRTRQPIDQGGHPQHRDRGLPAGGRPSRAGGRCGLQRGGRSRGQDRRCGQGAGVRCAAVRSADGRERGRAGEGPRRWLQPCPRPGHAGGQEHAAARGCAARCGADQRHRRGGICRYLRAPDLRRQRAGHGQERRCGQGHHRAHHRLRRGGRRQCRAGRGRRRCGGPGRDCARGARDRQERAPGAGCGQGHRIGWSRPGQW